jgi:hypothetical protein
VYKISLLAAVFLAATLVARPVGIDGGMEAGGSAEAAVWKKGKMGKGKMWKGKMMAKGKKKGKGPHCFQICVSKGNDPKPCNKRCE